MYSEFMKLAKEEWKPNEKPDPDIFDAKHLNMMQAIAPYVKKTVQKNVTDVDISYATRKTKLLMILMPEWAPEFPPFNIARLVAVAKKAGYQSNALDLNIKAYQYTRDKLYGPTKSMDADPWDGTREWLWLEANYHKDLHSHLEPLFSEYVNKICENPPDVIGFSVYYCNEEPVKWMIKQLKQRLPKIKIIVGGSNTHNQLERMRTWSDQNGKFYDYIGNGEGEMILLDILEEIENGVEHDTTQVRQQPEEQRINISNLPLPDYSDFDHNEYRFPNGVCSELSRGCTAKCTFCEETHFWRYRQRMSTDAVSEVEHLYYNYGTDVFWFIDSLVNGNINELRAFCKGIKAKDLKIHWTGYARCDGRMDLEYFQDLADSGCIMLNYGIESGSQKVLDDIAKGVTIKEMEQNLRDGAKTGVMAFTNWLIGFPTEKRRDFADTMTFLWRNRNTSFVNIAAGFGFGLGPTSIVGQNPEKFGVLDHQYMFQWMTKDFSLSKMHVLMRMKMFAAFLQNVKFEKEVTIPNRPNLPKFHYKIEFNDPNVEKEIEYENYEYNIANPDISNFADNMFNEMFVLWRLLWRTRGGFKGVMIFDEDLDMKEWGGRNAGPMWAEHTFEITDDGKWKARSWVKFKQPPTVTPADPMVAREPFFAQDYSRYQLNTAKRARVFAKPKWGEEGRSHDEFMWLLEEERILNQCVDLSFDDIWEGEGDWSDVEKYQIEVPGGESWRVAKPVPAVAPVQALTNEQVITFKK
jgi:hypothetical protein